MTEKQKLVWLLSMPSSIDANVAMQDLTDLKFVTDEQHKDMSKSRQERYYSMLQRLCFS